MSFASATNGALFAAILGDVDTARRIEDFLSSSVKIPTVSELCKIRGIGKKTAEKVLACCELSARYFVGTEAKNVTTPEEIAALLAFAKYEAQEHIYVVTLDSANHVIDKHELTTGLVNQTPVHPREAFRHAILDGAVSVIFAHNHPSGSLKPSPEDMSITRVLCAAGKILQIPVLDHIILSRTGVKSICREYPEIFEQTFNKAVTACET